MPDLSQPGTVSTLGIAIYVAGAGALLSITGALMMRGATRTKNEADEDEE